MTAKKKPTDGFFAGIADGFLSSYGANNSTPHWLDNPYKRVCFYIGFLEGFRRSTRHLITPEISDEIDDLMLRLDQARKSMEARYA